MSAPHVPCPSPSTWTFHVQTDQSGIEFHYVRWPVQMEYASICIYLYIVGYAGVSFSSFSLSLVRSASFGLTRNQFSWCHRARWSCRVSSICVMFYTHDVLWVCYVELEHQLYIYYWQQINGIAIVLGRRCFASLSAYMQITCRSSLLAANIDDWVVCEWCVVPQRDWHVSNPIYVILDARTNDSKWIPRTHFRWAKRFPFNSTKEWDIPSISSTNRCRLIMANIAEGEKRCENN